MPTPEEIRAACVEIQATWTTAVRQKHACAPKREAARIPVTHTLGYQNGRITRVSADGRA